MQLREYLKTHASQTGFASLLGVTQSAVSQWIRGRIPAERVLAIESATSGKVSRHELRPDLYPLAASTGASGGGEASAKGAPEDGIQREAA